MNPSIRTILALVFPVLTAIPAFAGQGSLKPLNRLSRSFLVAGSRTTAIRTADSLLTAMHPRAAAADRHTPESGKVSSRGHICSCQIVNLFSSNYQHRRMVLLAEKTNHGSAADFQAANASIEREKKQLRKLFYDKVTTVSTLTALGSCEALYGQLKQDDGQLRLYEILNADIR